MAIKYISSIFVLINSIVVTKYIKKFQKVHLIICFDYSMFILGTFGGFESYKGGKKGVLPLKTVKFIRLDGLKT